MAGIRAEPVICQDRLSKSALHSDWAPALDYQLNSKLPFSGVAK